MGTCVISTRCYFFNLNATNAMFRWSPNDTMRGTVLKTLATVLLFLLAILYREGNHFSKVHFQPIGPTKIEFASRYGLRKYPQIRIDL
jgi:hypothetical protein